MLPGIGRLVRVDRKARMGRNPATGEAIKIPAKKVVKFRVAKAAKDAIVPPKKEVARAAGCPAKCENPARSDGLAGFLLIGSLGSRDGTSPTCGRSSKPTLCFFSSTFFFVALQRILEVANPFAQAFRQFPNLLAAEQQYGDSEDYEKLGKANGSHSGLLIRSIVEFDTYPRQPSVSAQGGPGPSGMKTVGYDLECAPSKIARGNA